MRLICPNCGAQYEVDEAVIPEQGRDVQCSNCGHTWFQQPAHKDQDTLDELADEADLTQPTASPAEPEPEPGDPEPGPETGAETGHSATPEDDQSASADTPARKELDPEVAQLLREEAERETAARRAEANGLETQTELGLDSGAAERSAAARARMARLRGADEAETYANPSDQHASGPRKDLLPDVEEINSSLRPSQERNATDSDDLAAQDTDSIDPAPNSKGGAGRWLFRLIVIGALLALAVYVFAPQIAEQVPSAEPYLAQYVNAVNGARAQVDPLIAGLVAQVQGLIGGSDAPTPEPVPNSAPDPAPPASRERARSRGTGVVKLARNWVRKPVPTFRIAL